MPDVTQILSQIDQGDPAAAEQLLPLVYEHLKKLAAAKMAAERPDHTLQATALVHEAYLRLVGPNSDQSWDSRGHFFAAAAEAMRRILVENARRQRRVKHGGDLRKIDLDEALAIADCDPDYLLDLDEALSRFAQIDAPTAELVKLRLFAGLTNDEAAAARNLPASTAKKHWAYARSWLRRELGAEKGTGPICAKHPPGRPGKLDLSPFPRGGRTSSWSWSAACRSPNSAIKAASTPASD